MTAGKRGEKIQICHSTRGVYSKISIAGSAVEAHRKHGDGRPGDYVDGDTRYVFNDACEVEELACSTQLANLCDELFAAFDTLAVARWEWETVYDHCSGSFVYPPLINQLMIAVSPDSTRKYVYEAHKGYISCGIEQPPYEWLAGDEPFVWTGGHSCHGNAIVRRYVAPNGVHEDGTLEPICSDSPPAAHLILTEGEPRRSLFSPDSYVISH
jgi:hypothetical protein